MMGGRRGESGQGGSGLIQREGKEDGERGREREMGTK